jgi:hypothetical protein
MKANDFDALNFNAESWPQVSHMTTVDCFHKRGFNLNQSNDSEDITEPSIAKDNWGQLKAGVSFQDYVSCENNVVTCKVQTLEQIKDGKLTSDVSEEEEERGGRRLKK